MAGRAAQLAIDISEQGATDTANALDRVGTAASGMGDKVEAAGRSAEKGAAGLDKAAGGADEVASKGSQAAGAMGGLGELIGGPFGAAMQTGGIGLQAMADSGDLLNAALENSVVSSLRAKAATVSKTVADKASAVATKATTVAQRALNIAQRASPIGLIITGVLLLVGALVLAYKNSAKFRAIVDKAMSVAKAGVSRAVDAFKALGPVVRAVMSVVAKVVGIYVKVYVTAFQLGFKLAKAAWNGIKSAVETVIQAITGKVADMKGKLTEAWSTIKSKGKAAFQALTAPLQTLLDLVQNILDKIANIKIPKVDLNPFNRSSSSLLRASSSGRALTTSDVVTINVSVQQGAQAADADAFMKQVDLRLRQLGKQAVFSL